jgi:hypothetical protein
MARHAESANDAVDVAQALHVSREIQRLEADQHLRLDSVAIEHFAADVHGKDDPLLRRFPDALDILRQRRTRPDDERGYPGVFPRKREERRCVTQLRDVRKDVLDPLAVPNLSGALEQTDVADEHSHCVGYFAKLVRKGGRITRADDHRGDVPVAGKGGPHGLKVAQVGDERNRPKVGRAARQNAARDTGVGLVDDQPGGGPFADMPRGMPYPEPEHDDDALAGITQVREPPGSSAIVGGRTEHSPVEEQRRVAVALQDDLPSRLRVEQRLPRAPE